MKKKFLLPICAAALSMSMFAACSSGSDAPTDPNAGSNVPVVDPNQPAVDPNVPVVDPNTPADVPSNPVVDPNVPVVDPNIPVVDPNTPIAAPEGMNAHFEKLENTFPANVSVGAVDTAAYKYYGAELSGTDQFLYGRFEARMKMVSVPGTVSSMFLYYDNSYMLEDEPWNEIDIEILGKNPGEWQSNLITREVDYFDETLGRMKKSAKQTTEGVTGFGFDATKDFHLYAMIWTPEYISWEIDSVEVRRDVIGLPAPTTKQPKHDQVAFMTEEQTLRFNLWAAKSKAWVGQFTGEELADGPQVQWIDYVRVYDYDPATKGFTLNWQDDFDGTTLDRNHWTAGNWDMEYVKLSKDNVVVEDGYCKLLMTRVAK